MATSVPVPMAMPRSACGEGGGVVDPVADHGDDPAVGLEATDDVDLVGRQHLGDDVVDADLVGDRPGGALVVAGQQHRGEAEPAELGDRLAATVAFIVSATTNRARGSPSQPTTTAVRPSGLGAALAPASGAARCSAHSASSRSRARRPRRVRRPRPARRARRWWRTHSTGTTRPWSRGRGRRWPGDRVLGSVLDGADEAQHLSLGASVDRDDVDERHAPGGDGAGLVQHDGVDLPGGLEHLGPLDEDAELGAATGADQQGRRRGQTERAAGRR